MKDTVYKSYLSIHVEMLALKKEIEVLEYKMNKLIGEPKVASQNYGEPFSAKVPTPIEVIYENITELQKLINTKKKELDFVSSTLKEVETAVNKFLNVHDDADLQLFLQHYIQGIPLCKVKINKTRGTGYLGIRQINNLHKNLKKKLQNCLEIAL